jgi:3-hydroxyisobutyrate dehydrogenase
MNPATLGVVGLGAMGKPMAARFEAAGLTVMRWDADPARRTAATLGALVQADAILLSLPDDTACDATIAGLLEGARPGLLIVDTSTTSPEGARRRQAQAAAAGVAYVDAPVSGGPAGAEAGRLTVMIGGAEAALDRAEALLAPIAAKVLRCGGPGTGAAVKLANNLLVAAHLLLAGEALRLGEEAGVDPGVLTAALGAGSGRSGAIEANLPTWVLSGRYDSGFSLGLMAKDVGLAAALPGGLGPLGALAAAETGAALEAFGGGADFNRLVDRGRTR